MRDKYGNEVEGPLRRGIDTATGEEGYCEECGIHMPQGPDACLGYLEGVAWACCGHGGACEAYCVIGGEPNQGCHTIDTPVILRGPAALAYFREVT